jgi:aryl-alcohol dehydrogenase-like predicted oxidoreductase
MPVTTIGTSDLDVLPIALGGNVFGWTADQSASFEILDGFIAGGGSLVDTADSYSAFAPGNQGGESETVIGVWITARGARDKIVLATKVSQHPQRKGLSAANIAAASQDSLRRLQTDVIDLYWAHFDDQDTPLEETVGAFAELVSAGSVRYIGLSNYSADRIREWFEISDRLGVPTPVALQPHYNLMFREPFESELKPFAEAHNLGVAPYFALASGFLTGKYHSAQDAKDVPRSPMLGGYLTDSGFRVADEVTAIAQAHDTESATVALAWLRVQPVVVAPIASASKLAHLQPLLDSTVLELSDDDLQRLDRVSSAFQAA